MSVATTLLIQGCFGTQVVLAPGAEKVHLTQKPTEVANCTALGNVSAPSGQDWTTPSDFQNKAIGLGGNTVLITAQYMSAPISGIVYRCPQGA